MAPPRPHPLRESGVVHLSLPRGAHLTLSLIDPAGRRIRLLAGPAYFPPGHHEVRIEREGLVAGLYFLDLQSDAGSARQKLVVLP
jgi:hypothetical protein